MLLGLAGVWPFRMVGISATQASGVQTYRTTGGVRKKELNERTLSIRDHSPSNSGLRPSMTRCAISSRFPQRITGVAFRPDSIV